MEFNWELIAGIFSGLRVLEEKHGWDLSVGENACLAESFYRTFSAGQFLALPETQEALHKMFDDAKESAWGPANPAAKGTEQETWLPGETAQAEIRDFLFSVSDSFPHIVEYLKNFQTEHKNEQ